MTSASSSRTQFPRRGLLIAWGKSGALYGDAPQCPLMTQKRMAAFGKLRSPDLRGML